jgi:hypothetical protein
MDERARRLWSGTEAGAIGWGGVAAVARATGMAISTVRKGRDEARRGATPEDVVKVRRSAGKRPYEVAHPEVWPALENLVGNFKNGGREWKPKGEPDLVDVHDFPSDAVGKAIPYGVYDLAANEGFVSVGVDHDTPVFAVRSIEAWWSRVGAKRYPQGARDIHHRRRRGQQQLPVARVEASTATRR